MTKRTPIKTTRGMCASCREIVPANIFEEEGRVYQENICPECASVVSLVAENSAWYRDVIARPIRASKPDKANAPVRNGCPLDCGSCAAHENRPNLPVFSITNACNLNCPICFTFNRKDKLYHMPPEEMQKTVDFLLSIKDKYDLINITGGEPTLHPRLPELLKIAKHENIGRITMNSNGLVLAHDERLLETLRELDVYVILSFDTLDSAASVKIHGADIVERKLQALENLARYDIGVTLLNVMIKDVNDHEIFDVISLALKYKNVRSVTVQNMTFTGQGGSQFFPRERLTLDMAARIIAERSGGMIAQDHFFPLPSCHPLCYSIAYFFKNDSRLSSFTDLLSPEALSSLIGPNYIVRPDDEFHRVFDQAVAECWSSGDNEELLAFMKRLIQRLYPSDRKISPFERQKIAEESILTVYLHAHMDEHNFDVERVKFCPDLVPVDGERLIPACSYNLFYRMNDERFWPAANAR